MWPFLRNMFIAVFVMMTVAVVYRDLSGQASLETPGARATVDDEAGDDDGASDGEYEIAQGPNGHFKLEAEVNGESIQFMVDTGATVVALGPETAERLGFDLDELDFSRSVRTANGTAPVARVILDEIVVGDLTVNNVEAVVLSKPMGISLLGMSFLAQLDGYEVRDGRFVMHW